MLIRTYITIITLLVLSCDLDSQSLLKLIDDNTEKIEIPFMYQGGYIIIQTMINEDKVVNMILDTGAEHIILFEPAKARWLGLSADEDIKVKGSDLEGEILATISRSNTIRLNGSDAIKKDFIILKENDILLSNLTGLTIDGLVGGRLFWGVVMKIDYQKNLLTLYNKRYFDANANKLLKKYNPVDIEMKLHKPYVTTTLEVSPDKSVEAKTLVDTGSALGLLVLVDTDPQLQLPAKHIPGPLGRGLGGQIQGYIGTLTGLNLDQQFDFNNLISHYQFLENNIDSSFYWMIDRNAIIGNPLLSRFTMIIDYVHKKLYLKPNKNYKKPFRYDHSGLIIYAAGAQLDQYYVKDIIKGTPADRMDIQPGDQIIGIGLRPKSLLDLQNISHKLQGKPGRKVKIRLLRKGQKMTKKLILEDYLK